MRGKVPLTDVSTQFPRFQLRAAEIHLIEPFLEKLWICFSFYAMVFFLWSLKQVKTYCFLHASYKWWIFAVAASNQYSQSVFHYGKLKQLSLILVYLLFSFAITSITRCNKQNNLFCSARNLRFYFIFVSRDVAPAELLQLNFVTYQVKWPLWQTQQLSHKQTVPNYRKRSH